MRAEEATGLLDEYARWIRSNMTAVQQGDAVRIIGPMLDRHNDNMSVVIAESPDGGYILTDLGETVDDLAFCGCDVLKSEHRREKLEQTLRGYGVSHEGPEMYVRSSRQELLQKMNFLFQAMASVDDLFFLASDSVRNLFIEDVRNWMFKNDIRALDGPSFPGKSGLLYKYDFAIPRSRRAPERLVKTVNNPIESNVRNALFGWQDIEEVRRKCRGFVILNATKADDGPVRQDLLDACERYDISAIQWGIDQDSFIEQLAA